MQGAPQARFRTLNSTVLSAHLRPATPDRGARVVGQLRFQTKDRKVRCVGFSAKPENAVALTVNNDVTVRGNFVNPGVIYIFEAMRQSGTSAVSAADVAERTVAEATSLPEKSVNHTRGVAAVAARPAGAHIGEQIIRSSAMMYLRAPLPPSPAFIVDDEIEVDGRAVTDDEHAEAEEDGAVAMEADLEIDASIDAVLADESDGDGGDTSLERRRTPYGEIVCSLTDGDGAGRVGREHWHALAEGEEAWLGPFPTADAAAAAMVPRTPDGCTF